MRGFTMDISLPKPSAGVAVSDAGSAPELVDNRIYANEANADAGGVFLARGHDVQTVQGNAIYRNISGDGGNGGGIFCGTPATRLLLTGNCIAQNDAGGRGGGVFVEGGGHVVIEGNRIERNNPSPAPQNRSRGHGGGIACDGTVSSSPTTLRIADNLIRGNAADVDCSRGGGIYVFGSVSPPRTVNAEIESNLVFNNSSQIGAGIALENKVFGPVQYNQLKGNRVLLVVLARPSLLERRPNWGEGEDWHERIELKRLSKHQSRQLVREILKKVADIPKVLESMVVNQAEGNRCASSSARIVSWCCACWWTRPTRSSASTCRAASTPKRSSSTRAMRCWRRSTRRSGRRGLNAGVEGGATLG